MWVDRTISLQAAYNIADRAATADVQSLFRALDRFDADMALINEDSRAQRREAIQRLAAELDKRNVPVRNPIFEQRAVQLIREQLGFSQCGTRDLHPGTPDHQTASCF